MRTTMGRLTLAVILVLTLSRLVGCGGDSSDGADVFTPALALDEALALSALEGKPAFVYVQALWCPLCTRVREQTLSDPAVQDALRAGTVATSVSISERSIDAASRAALIRLNVTVVPTIILYADGVERARLEGVVQPGPLVAWLASNGASPTNTGAATGLDVGGDGDGPG